MELFESILAIRNDAKAIGNLIAAVVRLFENLMTMHGMFAGTHEAVLAEAQGAQLLDGAGRVFVHRNSLVEAGRALANREKEIEQGLTSIARHSSGLAAKTRSVLQPLLEAARSSKALIAETEAHAIELSRTHGTRLQNVPLSTGGMGPAVARDQGALVSSQLNAQAASLSARGITPTLLPNVRGAQAYLFRIRQLAINNSDSTARIGAILTAMRLAIRQSLAQASAMGRALLATVWEPLLAALDLLATRLGGLFATPLIIPAPVLRAFRFQSAEEA